METTRQQEQFKEQKSKIGGAAIVYKSKSSKNPEADIEIDEFWSELQEKVKAITKPSVDKSLELVRKHPVAFVVGAVAFGFTVGFLASSVIYPFKKSRNE